MNNMLIIDGKVIDRPLTEEEFEELWKRTKEADERRADRFDALPEAEKQRINDLLESSFGQRMRTAVSSDDVDVED